MIAASTRPSRKPAVHAAAALLVRLVHYLSGDTSKLEALVYVDDYLHLAGDQRQVESLGFFVFVFCSSSFADSCFCQDLAVPSLNEHLESSRLKM